MAILGMIPLDTLLLSAENLVWRDFEGDIVHFKLIGEESWVDADGDWRSQCSVNTTRAILAKPDGTVTWGGVPNDEFQQE